MLCQNPITIISTFYTIASINSFYLGWACKLNAETGAKKEWRKRNSAKFLTNLLETSCLIADLIVYDRMESENEQNKKHMRTLMGWAAFGAVKSSHLFPFSDRNLEIWKFRMCFLDYRRIISMCRNLEQKYHTSFRHRCDIKSESIETKKRHKTEKVKLQIASKNNSISNRSFLISHLNQLMQINRLKNTQWIHFTLTMPCGLIGLERIGFRFGFFLGFLHSNIFWGHH